MGGGGSGFGGSRWVGGGSRWVGGGRRVVAWSVVTCYKELDNNDSITFSDQ